MLATRFETLAGRGKLRLARLGRGSPVVLLHGYPDNLQIWSELAPKLAQGHEVFAFDWPGMGYSEPWSGGTTFVHQAERLLNLLDHWGLKRAAIVGADMGGQPALAFAAQHPERVSQLVVMNCLAAPEERTSWEIQLLRQYGFNRRILRWFPGIVFGRAERTFLPDGVRLTQELRQDLWDAFRRRPVREFIIRLCAGYQGTLPQLPRLYEAIRRPTLILWADDDGHFPVEHAHKLHADIRDSKLTILSHARHWMAWCMAERIAQDILAFLRKGR